MGGQDALPGAVVGGRVSHLALWIQIRKEKPSLVPHGMCTGELERNWQESSFRAIQLARNLCSALAGPMACAKKL